MGSDNREKLEKSTQDSSATCREIRDLGQGQNRIQPRMMRSQRELGCGTPLQAARTDGLKVRRTPLLEVRIRSFLRPAARKRELGAGMNRLTSGRLIAVQLLSPSQVRGQLIAMLLAESFEGL